MKEISEELRAENREEIIAALRDTERKGVDDLIAYMDEAGFFEAPCSTQYHLSCEGGLAQHSLHVCNTIIGLARQLCITEFPRYHTLVIVGLLHDLGKVGDRYKPMYVENVLKKTGKRSESKPYVSNPDLLYIPHEVRSIAIAERFISLTEEEEHAILFHNGMYSELKYSYQGKEQMLDLLLHFADMWCSRITEKEEGSTADE